MPKCLNCEKETKNPKFCSKSCAASMNNRLFPKRLLQGSCKKCTKVISSRNSYCKDCNPNNRDYSKITLGDIKSRRVYQKHSQVRDLSRRVYINSGRPSSCEICGYDKHFEVCHVKAIKDFDDNTPINVVNSLNNLVGLCPNCHWELDNGLLSLDFPEFDHLHS